MIFFNNHPAAIYIRKKSLEFFVGNNRKNLEFPDDIVSNGDVVNQTKYDKFIEDFITANNLQKQKVLLILAEDIVYDKTFPSEDLKIIDDKIDDYLSMVPIDPEKIAKKTIKSDKGIYFFAVNKDLFEKLVEILERLALEVLAVVPLTAFSTETNLTPDLIGRVYGNSNLLNESNLLSEAPDLSNYSSVRKILAVILVLGILIAGGWFVMTNNYFNIQIPFLNQNQQPSKETPQSTPTPTATVTTAPSTPSGTLSKDQLKASVLNGTGIAGQAAKVKDILVGLGLSKIETGNVEGPPVSDTTVLFSDTVATDLQKQIIASLEDMFATVSAKKNTSSPSADIVITTGKPKNP